MCVFFKNVKKVLFSLPVQLISVVLLGITLSPQMDSQTLGFFLALSLTIKDVLLFLLPVIIFSCVSNAVLGIAGGALFFVISMVLGLCASNFTSTLIAYFTSPLMLHSSVAISAAQAKSQVNAILPLWEVSIPSLIKNDRALLIGVIFGLVASFTKWTALSKFSQICLKISVFFLNRIFIPILPVFVFGFILSLSRDETMTVFLKNNSSTVLKMTAVLLSYLIFLFLVMARFSRQEFVRLIKNVFPAALTAFSTMSSVAALPLSIKAAENSAGDSDKNKSAARAIIPATVNIHLVGDSIMIPLMAMVILSSFGQGVPSFSSYLVFAFYFVMAKFAVAAVPGGGILVMVPILESQLGFTGEMSALITTFYILLDPIITSANVFGNNAFATLFTRLFHFRKATI